MLILKVLLWLLFGVSFFFWLGLIIINDIVFGRFFLIVVCLLLIIRSKMGVGFLKILRWSSILVVWSFLVWGSLFFNV